MPHALGRLGAGGAEASELRAATIRGRRMNRVLLAIGGLLVGLLALLFAAPAMVDWNRYRGVFEEEASRFLGREVRVGGRVNLRLLPVPYVRFEKVRVADTTATVGRPLFQADDFTVWLSIGALLGGGFEASEIELRKPVLTLVLDGKGGGSWSSLAQHPKPAGQPPLRIAFNAVRITNGTVAILSPQGETRSQVEFVNGELSAQALEGPYKIAAAFALGGAPREIRLSTSKPTEDGTVRFKGTVRDPASGVSYSLDGQARDVLDKLKVTGVMTAKLPLPAALAGRPAGKATGEDFDVRAELKGDTSGFSLADLALSFEQAGRPQLASGSARVNWAQTTDVAIALKSHWLDLDRIAGGDKAASPLQLMQALADSFGRVLATEGRTQAALTVEQATFGGDVVSDLSATLEHVNGKLAVQNLSASLPGGARLTATGSFERRQENQHYEGQVNLRGASLARFLGWAARGRDANLTTNDGAFSVVGGVSIGATEIAGRNLTIQLGRNTLTGEAGWKAGKPQQIVVNLDGSEFDLTPLLEAGADPVRGVRALIARLANGDRSKVVATPGTAAPAATPTDADIRLRVDRLVLGKSLFRDAIAELHVASGNLSVTQLRLASDEGYSIEVKGDIASLAQQAAKGTLTGIATADRGEGITALARFLTLPGEFIPTAEHAAQLAPLRLAGRLHVGAKGPETHDLALDGTAAQNRVAGTLRLGPETANWRDRPADLAISLDGRDLPQLLARLTGASRPADAATGSAATRLTLRGVGTARGGLTSLGALEGQEAAAEYRGRVSLDDAGILGLDGDLTLAFGDLGHGLALAALPPMPALAGPVAGSLKVAKTAGRLQLATAQMKLAGNEASGTLAVDTDAGAPYRLSGDIKLNSASFPGFLAALTSGGGSARGGTARGQPASGSTWSEAPLDLSAADRIAGSKVRFDIARLGLIQSVELSDARIDLTARAGGIDVRLTEAKALGGRSEGLLTLDKAQAGVRLTVDGRLAGGRLDGFGAHGGGPPTATGGFLLSFKAAASALTPRGLIVGLAGGGELGLEQARLNRWSPTGIATAAEAVIATTGEIPPGLLLQQLDASLRSGGIAIGSRKLALTIADGALQTAPLVANTQRGRITGRATVDLDGLRLDGEWRIEPSSSPQALSIAAKSELPGIAVIYAGPLATIGTLEPRLDIAALEREVAVRKVEREVAELERLRKLDEERAASERLLAEQRRLDSLQQAPNTSQILPAQPGGPPPIPGSLPNPNGSGGGTSALPSAPVAGQPGAALGSGSPPNGPAGSQAIAGDVPPLSVPPVTVQRAPLPAAGTGVGAAPAPAKAKKGGDPFRSLREYGP